MSLTKGKLLGIMASKNLLADLTFFQRGKRRIRVWFIDGPPDKVRGGIKD